jgi:hypothetical protein
MRVRKGGINLPGGDDDVCLYVSYEKKKKKDEKSNEI